MRWEKGDRDREKKTACPIGRQESLCGRETVDIGGQKCAPVKTIAHYMTVNQS